MARMYPKDIEDLEKATDGEKQVFRFLKEAARPSKNFLCWYQPPIGPSGRTPDFVLFGKELGLLVIAVCDWRLQEIIAATPFKFTIRLSEEDEIRTNPDKQAKGYVNCLMEKLKGTPGLLPDIPRPEGPLKIPIGRMVVFPNMRRDAFRSRGFHWFVPVEKALFQNDLEAAGEILCDRSGRKFHERISDSFPFRFQGITQGETEKIALAIWPETIMELPVRQGKGKTRFQKAVRALDEVQARFALRLGKGHHIIKGPPGSGKTLVLVERSCQLYRYHTQVKRILLVCYNIALTGYLKRLVQEKGVGVGEDGIQVYHFFELCSQVLREPIRYENEQPDYYVLVIQEALSRVGNGKCHLAPFDAILVDEGQDFSDEMLKILLGLLKPKGDLVIGLDTYQDLYKRRRSWKSLGIKASGRTHYMRRVYRNTVEIFDFAQRFIGKAPALKKRQLSLLPHDFAFRGDLPMLRRFRNHEEMEDFLVEDLLESIDQEEYKRSEIAVIYDDKIYSPEGFAYDNRALPMRILRKLNASGIPATWVSQDVRAKEMFDVTTDRVSLISIHSAKGLDFDLVYLVGIDHIHIKDSTRKDLIFLVYVAMTRAKYRLVIPYVQESELIKRMRQDFGAF